MDKDLTEEEKNYESCAIAAQALTDAEWKVETSTLNEKDYKRVKAMLEKCRGIIYTAQDEGNYRKKED